MTTTEALSIGISLIAIIVASRTSRSVEELKIRADREKINYSSIRDSLAKFLSVMGHLQRDQTLFLGYEQSEGRRQIYEAIGNLKASISGVKGSEKSKSLLDNLENELTNKGEIGIVPSATKAIENSIDQLLRKI